MCQLLQVKQEENSLTPKHAGSVAPPAPHSGARGPMDPKLCATLVVRSSCEAADEQQADDQQLIVPIQMAFTSLLSTNWGLGRTLPFVMVENRVPPKSWPVALSVTCASLSCREAPCSTPNILMTARKLLLHLCPTLEATILHSQENSSHSSSSSALEQQEGHTVRDHIPKHY